MVESVTETLLHKIQRFRVDRRTTWLTVVLLPLLVSLGCWQLERAAEKRNILANVEARQSQSPVVVESVTSESPEQRQYRRVILEGTWLDKTLLLDNQVQHGKVGCHVLSIMALRSGGYVLVNRGWMPVPSDRRTLPSVSVPVGEESVGELYLGEHWLEDKPVYAEDGWPKRVQRIHLPGLARELGVDLLPYVIRLSAGAPGALSVEWAPVNTLPEKHVAYAIQWFAMAIALVVFYVFLGLRDEPALTVEERTE